MRVAQYAHDPKPERVRIASSLTSPSVELPYEPWIGEKWRSYSTAERTPSSAEPTFTTTPSSIYYLQSSIAFDLLLHFQRPCPLRHNCTKRGLQPHPTTILLKRWEPLTFHAIILPQGPHEKASWPWGR